MQVNHAFIRGIAADLRAMLGEDFDTEAFLDTLDGETDALDIADALIRDMQEADALASATKALADEYAARAKRISARSEAIKRSLLMLLEDIGEKKLERPGATISRRAGSVSVRIVNADDVPRQLCKVTYTPDKTAIRKQIEDGETVPGAELVRGDDGLTVRTK